MRDERWTVMVLSDAAEPVRRLSLRPGDVRRLAVGVPVLGGIPVAMLVGVSLWLMTGLLPGVGWSPGVDPVQVAVQEELGETYQRVQGLEAELARLEEREARLRVLAGVGDFGGREGAESFGPDRSNGGEGSIASGPDGSNGGESPAASRRASSSTSWWSSVRHLFWAPRPAAGNGATLRPDAGSGLRLELQPVEERSRLLAQRMDHVSDSLDARRTLVHATPAILPAAGYVSSVFSRSRVHPVHGDRRPHQGIDVAAMPGTEIRSAAAGEVTFSGHRPGYGRMVEIEHGHGYSTLYAHARTLLVSEGDWVERGDVIGEVGNTGTSTGPHVHFEIHVDGRPVDPQEYVPSTHASAS